MSGHWAEGRRPLAMRSQDDRGPVYTAAVEQSEAAFAAVRGVLGDGALVDTAAELAAVAEALPPETPVLLADWPRIAAGQQAADGWVEVVGATMAMVAGPPVTPVRDQAGREHDVISPALQLGVFVLPGPDDEVPGETEACGYYARAIEALEREGPGVSLPAVGALLRHIADLLGPDSDCSPAGYLPDASPVAGYIAEEAWRLRNAAAALTEIARVAEQEEAAADDEDDREQAAPTAVTDAMTEAFRAAAEITPAGPSGGAGQAELAEAADRDEEESGDGCGQGRRRGASARDRCPPRVVEIELADGTRVSMPYRETAQAQDDAWRTFRDSGTGTMLLGAGLQEDDPPGDRQTTQ